MPVIPATWEAEAGELLEPRMWRLQSVEIAPLHSSLGNKSKTLSQKKKKLVMNKAVLKDLGILIIIFSWNYMYVKCRDKIEKKSYG